jgi:putative membrane protein
MLPLAHYGGPVSVALGLVAVTGCALSYLAYHSRAQTLARQGRPVRQWREWCFAGGLLVLLAAISPPVDRISDQLFLAHMAQHLLIGDFAALLLVLGLTGPLLQPVLHHHWIERLRILTHPAVALPVWAVNFYLWHLPFMYEAALRHELVHGLQHLTFLVFGAAMWMPLFGPLPKPVWFGNFARLGYITIVRLTGTLLANVFFWSGSVFYSIYAPGEAHHGISALTDQSIAGAIMMVEESVLTICLFAWLFLKAAAEGEERQELIEFASARGMQLSERRAARAVSAGRGEELRRRIEAGTLVPEPGEGEARASPPHHAAPA